MSDQTYQRRENLAPASLANNSLLPRGFGLHYIWTRLKVYLLLIAFLVTGFGAVAAAMTNRYGWIVLFAAFWLLVGCRLLPAYGILPERVQLTKRMQLILSNNSHTKKRIVYL
jgi:hypothetical protein